MKIAVLGSAPSSLLKAPLGDPEWAIWACSPGAYPHLNRVDEFWEVHRWEPGVIGKAATQKPWFTPEYVEWLKRQPCVWVADPAALRDLPNGRELPWRQLVEKYGHYCWTSSIAYMSAMAIEKILAARGARTTLGERDVIGIWGVDMAANEELYSGQRWACQWFLQVMVGLGIEIYLPPESDLAVPPPMYGVAEVNHRAIKWLERRRELEARLAQANAQMHAMQGQSQFLQGALDDLDYMQKMWLHEGDSLGFDFAKFPELAAKMNAPLKPEAPPATLAEVGPRAVLPEVHKPNGEDPDPPPATAVHGFLEPAGLSATQKS